MSAIKITIEDFDLLQQITPDLNFDDAERQAALLESNSRDFNAAPGSGKTSLLAAKLLLLAKKWPHQRKGICILSHTNVAQKEIAHRLSQTNEGMKLLSYPHFIGTIHSFINHFLAMTALRSLGLHVDIIDDDVFEKRALAKLTGASFRTLNAWLDRQHNADSLISKLYLKGSGFDLLSEGGKLPSETTVSGKQISRLKSELLKEGVFRHRDMFAFAEYALHISPELADAISHRFPMVFIDEMQDTSWEQENILNRIFDNKSVIQRFGDVDQKIITNDEEANKVTFPKSGHGTISSSKRFGSRIANAVSNVRISKLSVTGESSHDNPPMLLLYEKEHVEKVIPRFGEIVIDQFGASFDNRSVKAMCSRKSGDSTVPLGRHLGDYWPPLLKKHVIGVSTNCWHSISNNATNLQKETLLDASKKVRRAILQTLRAAKSPAITDIRDERGLLRAISDHQLDITFIQRLILKLTLNPELFESLQARTDLPKLLLQELQSLIPKEMDLETFKKLEVFSEIDTDISPKEFSNVCKLNHSGYELDLELGTVASMKGETHFASLVLESFGRNRKFDLELAIPYIAGLKNDITKLTAAQQTQMRNVYVAMSRPSHFLCLAANESRVSPLTRSALEAKGWQIEHLKT